MLSLSDLDVSKFSPEARSALSIVQRTTNGDEAIEDVLAELGIDAKEHKRRVQLLQVEWRAQAGDLKLPPLTAEEYAALRDSIQTVGQQHDILRAPEFDNWVVDGDHRERICLELGIEPRYRDVFGSKEELESLAFVVNLARRQLTAEARRGIVASELLRDPERSDRAIAATIGVTHPTVGKVRRELVEAGQVESVTTSRQGRDGKTYPAKPPAPRPEPTELPDGVVDVTLRIGKDVARELDAGAWKVCKAMRLVLVAAGVYELELQT